MHKTIVAGAAVLLTGATNSNWDVKSKGIKE
jgi:hypothetical protein